ncbi:TlpA disulfide reductase family protein [Ferruginibacter albus]|uniref:TlpA disulfide reductase family protein n=1 Tax=Ferruginibacter albus TaxID=2875540 RepID=UPI001CC625C4|nr:TlpA disulfide reductase family protein [Ferruginibacter albus]UAY51852.1 AhpC/TSA family protein [Ferruginibacter albus]
MKQLLTLAMIVFCLSSCKSKSGKQQLTITGEIKNAPDQKIYIEQLFFSQQNPEVLDTAEIKNGKFSLSALAQEEGLYRIRLENNRNNNGFVFINDTNNIVFTTDYNNPTVENTSFGSYANSILKNFFIKSNSFRNALEDADGQVHQLKTQNASDSAVAVASKNFDEKNNAYKEYVISFIDSVSDPINAVYALGYTGHFDPNDLAKSVVNMGRHFPKNVTVTSIAEQYRQLIDQYNRTPHIGGIAPNISLPDTSGKVFSLSSLRGKYVLVDFWASWCRPCRGENPNVVKAYNEYKDKGFTVLGVSLDQDKQAWIHAINADKLTWTHISDLQNWSSKAVSLYGFNAIPYNVLVSPEGKIIAVGLTGKELEMKLAEVIK